MLTCHDFQWSEPTVAPKLPSGTTATAPKALASNHNRKAHRTPGLAQSAKAHWHRLVNAEPQRSRRRSNAASLVVSWTGTSETCSHRLWSFHSLHSKAASNPIQQHGCEQRLPCCSKLQQRSSSRLASQGLEDGGEEALRHLRAMESKPTADQWGSGTCASQPPEE